MDQHRFDQLARALGAGATRRAGLRAVLGGLLGVGLGAGAATRDAAARRRRGAADADRKKRRKRCKPACTNGFECVKVGRKRACECVSGAICGAACCRTGQVCDGSQCVPEPGPGTCIAAGEPCKSVGIPCCGGRTCASGQGGDQDIACYVPKTGACAATADCVYGMRCQDGRCAPPAPGALAQPCDAAAQQLCITPGAVCAAYTGAGAPGGTFCALPLQKTCTGNPQCTCYKCWYTAATVTGAGRRGDGRASTNTMSCCHVAGLACTVDQDCCLGLECVNGTCGGTLCTPDNAEGCGPDAPCCNEGAGATCVAGTCQTCGPATCPDGCCRDGQCIPYDSQDVATCGAAGAACAACPTTCRTATCTSGVCGGAPLAVNTACTRDGGGSGVCNRSQQCVECNAASQCTNTVGECQTRSCSVAGVCGATDMRDGTTCATGGTVCAGGVCGACTASSCPDGCCDGTTCDRTGLKCRQNDGACGTSCTSTPGTRCAANGTCEACDVYPTCSGSGCKATLDAAIADTAAYPAGSTIKVAPGIYETNAQVTRTLTIQRCGAFGDVVLQQSGNEGSYILGRGSTAAISASFEVTLVDVTLRTAPASGSQIGGVYARGRSGYDFRFKLTAVRCRFENLKPAIRVGDLGDADVSQSILDGSGGSIVSGTAAGATFVATASTFRNASESVFKLSNVAATLTDCTVSGGRGSAYSDLVAGGGIQFEASSGNSVTLALAGSTSVTGNQASLGGGVAMIGTYGGTATLEMTGTSTVTGNTAVAANGGGGVFYYPLDDSAITFQPAGYVAATGTATRVSGNAGVGAQCVLSTYIADPTVAITTTPVANCTPA